MLPDLLHPHPVEKVAETRAFLLEPPLQRAHVRTEGMRDFANRRTPARHQQPDRLLDLLGDRAMAWVNERADEFPRMGREGLVRARQGPVQVFLADDDAIEVRIELQRTVEQPVVNCAIGWPRAFIAEADALRTPAIGHDRPAHL